MRITNIAVLALAQWAVAQLTDESESSTITGTATDSASTSTTSGSSTSTQGVTHTISVGGTGHTFFPEVVQAGVGSTVEFAFLPTNHSVIRAEYKSPCIPYELTGVDKIGFTSGFKPVDAILPEPPTFSVTINDTFPIFFYCSAPGSCIDWQMVGVINPNASVSLEVQKEFAANSSFMLQWGERIPDEAESPMTSTGSPTTTVTANPAASDGSNSGVTSSESHGLSSGAIAGIAIGGAAVLVAAAGLLFYCGRKSRSSRAAAANATMPQPPAYVPPMAANGYDGRYSMPPVSPGLNKHMSVTPHPLHMTDAFGNPIQTSPQFPQAFAPPGQPYPPHLAHLNQQHPMFSPNAEIFGNPASPNNYPQSPPPPETNTQASEIDSLRASSPATVANPPQSQVGGIEGFLQRQSNPSGTGDSPNTPLMSHRAGPVFEMSSTGTVTRDQR